MKFDRTQQQTRKETNAGRGHSPYTETRFRKVRIIGLALDEDGPAERIVSFRRTDRLALSRSSPSSSPLTISFAQEAASSSTTSKR